MALSPSLKMLNSLGNHNQFNSQISNGWQTYSQRIGRNFRLIRQAGTNMAAWLLHT